VFSPEFQRLRYVRLCNINSLYLTGASEPKRFEHCLGVYHLSNLWIKTRHISARQVFIVRAAALLHDLFTGPFGHSFQYVMEDNPFEQQFEHANLSVGIRNRYLQGTHAGAQFAGRPFSTDDLLGDTAEEVYSAIRGEGLFGPIISGTLDLDNLDNVVRLAFHMGLCSDRDRAIPLLLAPLLEPRDGYLGARTGAGPLIERWFDIRRRSYEYLLLDRGEFAAKAMLTFAIERAADARLLGPDDWRLTDENLLSQLEQRSIGDHQIIGNTVKRLRLGDLFDCIGVWRTEDITPYPRLSESEAKRELERQIEQEVASIGAQRSRICLHYILDKKKTCRSISYRNLDLGNDVTIGYNSCVLLVGAFVINARTTELTAQERERLSGIIKGVLGRAGLAGLSPAAEPLAPIDSSPTLFAT
jgi:HD superfamily phosphohydrolase